MFTTKDLNPSQLIAVTYCESPLLVLSGAGTGKTRVITYKIAYLVLEKKIPLNRILAITFTNKAASEMRDRTFALLEEKGFLKAEDRKSYFISTFHASCVKILRIHGKLLGYTSAFTIIDDSDKTTLLKQMIKERSYKHLIKIREVKTFIEQFKNDFLTHEDIVKKAELEKNAMLLELADLYDLYNKTLFKMNMMDFDDLLINVIKLFYQEPDINHFWKKQFAYILVDEFQDTNKIQYLFLKLLINESASNLTVVGDDDQSIYSFRGASINNILNLPKEFPSLKIVKVEENYRSTASILDVANDVIEKNENRMGKKLYPFKKKESSKPFLYMAFDDRDEAYFVIQKVKEHLEQGLKIAIIYRTNSQSRIFESNLSGDKVPYVILGAKRFYDRREIKDLVSFLKLIYNHKDDIAFKRILPIMQKGIGEVTLAKIQHFAEGNTLSLLESLNVCEDWGKTFKVKDSILKGLKDFSTLIEELKDVSLKNPAKLLELLIESIDYIKYLENYGNEGERTYNIKELTQFYTSYFKEEKEATFEGFMEKIELLDSSDTAQNNESINPVYLSTVHGCKGLEFDVVFVVGLAEELFPHYLTIQTKEDLEEERRLFYVAVTRARSYLYLSFPQKMLLRGNIEYYFKSRFLNDIKADLLEINLGKTQTNEAWFTHLLENQ